MEIIDIVNKLFQIRHENMMLCQLHSHLCTPTKVISCGISVLFKDLFFHKSNKQVSIVGTHFSSHSYNTYLFVMLTIKGKIVEGEHQLS